ncbi:MAG TPA: VRR-NUC domain-containing protein [Acidimicrobiales bacterium]|nr:VRR-NUC domain-containing protein [Acidimicrobiales bacterium]
MTTLAINEKSWMRQVVDLARIRKWAIYHTQLSKWSESGWPDLSLVRPPRLILAELKSERGKVSAAQVHWLSLLQECPGVEVYLWRPADLDTVADILR